MYLVLGGRKTAPGMGGPGRIGTAMSFARTGLVVEVGGFRETLARLRIDVRFFRIGDMGLDGCVD